MPPAHSDRRRGGAAQESQKYRHNAPHSIQSSFDPIYLLRRDFIQPNGPCLMGPDGCARSITHFCKLSLGSIVSLPRPGPPASRLRFGVRSRSSGRAASIHRPRIVNKARPGPLSSSLERNRIRNTEEIARPLAALHFYHPSIHPP